MPPVRPGVAFRCHVGWLEHLNQPDHQHHLDDRRADRLDEQRPRDHDHDKRCEIMWFCDCDNSSPYGIEISVAGDGWSLAGTARPNCCRTHSIDEAA